MKERPILFSGEMVRAILDGRKTQTRRVVKEQPHAVDGGVPVWKPRFRNDVYCTEIPPSCPYGKPGDRLWVREKWMQLGWSGEISTADGGRKDTKLTIIEYAANGRQIYKPRPSAGPDTLLDTWRPSIHMPRWASRITLEIKSVRVERLQRISDVDCVAEGIDGPFDGPPIHNDGKSFQYWRDYSGGNNYCTPRGAYRSLWNGINNKKPGASWQDNPWVWVVEFEQQESDK